MSEVWKDIPGYEGAYQVSSLGRVRSLDRVIARSDGKGGVVHQRIKSRVLRLCWNRRVGYSYVVLTPNRTNYRVHRLVAEAFLGPCPEGMEVRHLDGDSSNNAASNLAYGTHTENIADMVAHGTRQKQCKLRPEDVRSVREMISAGVSDKKIADCFGVHERTIFRIRHGKVYRWVA